MIPRLFKPDATDFNAVGYGPITTTIRATVTEELNQAPTLEMELLVTDPLLDTIIVGSIIAAKPNAVDPVQAFVVEEITKPLDGVIRIYAPHIAQHRAQLLVLFTPLNKTGLDNLFSYLSGPMSTLPMNNPFKFVRAENKPDSPRSFKIDTPRTLRETMGGTEGSIISVYGGEWGFDNFTCTLYSKRGRESGARVLYGRNMTDFNLDEFYDFNLNMSATGCVGWGQYEEDGTTHTIIGDLQVSDNAFDVFPYVRAAAVDFSEGIKYQHTKELVNNLAKAWLRVRGAIGTTAEVAFNHIDGGEDIGMGDTIRIYNNVYNYEARSRVVGLRYDVIAETYESVTIGEQRTTLSEAIQDTAGGSYSYSGGGGSSVDPSTTLPIMDGTAAIGTEQTYARGDHVHPTDTSRLGVNDTAANSYYLQDPNTNAYKIQARYGGDGITSVPTWVPIYNNLGNNIIELSPVHKGKLVASTIQKTTQSINWTVTSSGGVYYHRFSTKSLWNIEDKDVLKIGMSYYQGNWRILNFYPYEDSSQSGWVVITNLNTNINGTIILYYIG